MLAQEKNEKQQRKPKTIRENTAQFQQKTAAKKPRHLKKGVKHLGRPLKVLRIFKFIIPPYFRNSWKELQLVKWPNRKETRQLTFAVFWFSIVFGILISLVDYGLDKVFKRILLM